MRGRLKDTSDVSKLILNQNKMKQTAVEWVAEEAMKLIKQYMTGTINEDTIEEDVYKIIIRGKEMEKENIINAWMATDNELQRLAAEKYYNETFKSQEQRIIDMMRGDEELGLYKTE